MNLTTNTEIKTIKGWEKYADEHSGENTDWGAYCKPGDIVGEDVYDYFLDILPPRTLTQSLLQVGEPHSHMMNLKTGKYQATYATFETIGKSDGAMFYRYCGNCFAGETQDMDIYRPYASVNEYLKATYRMSNGFQEPRPHILCKDGFEFSVQAGKFLYSTPRTDGPDIEYTACECGMPSTREELLIPYMESTSDEPTEAIYPYTPVEVIEQVIAKHGGYFIAGLPVV